MEYPKADLFPRFLAALIDGVIGWIFVVIPFIGGIICCLYLLFKDGLMYRVTGDEMWKNKSIGKKLMNLEIKNQTDSNIDLALSARRNIPLTIGSIIAIIPIIGWILGGLVGFIFAAIELIMLLIDDKGRRLGDRWAKTQVIEITNEDQEDDYYERPDKEEDQEVKPE